MGAHSCSNRLPQVLNSFGSCPISRPTNDEGGTETEKIKHGKAAFGLIDQKEKKPAQIIRVSFPFQLNTTFDKNHIEI